MKPFRELGHFITPDNSLVCGYLIGQCKSNGSLEKGAVTFLDTRLFMQFIKDGMVQGFVPKGRDEYYIQYSSEERRSLGYFCENTITREQYLASDRTFILHEAQSNDCLYLCMTHTGKAFGHTIVRMTYWHTVGFVKKSTLNKSNARKIHLLRVCDNYGTLTGEINLVRDFIRQLQVDVSFSVKVFQDTPAVVRREDVRFWGTCSVDEQLSITKFFEKSFNR